MASQSVVREPPLLRQTVNVRSLDKKKSKYKKDKNCKNKIKHKPRIILVGNQLDPQFLL